MTVASPCTGVCKLDEATGWCLGCARTGDEIAEWRTHEDAWRAAVWQALPARFRTLGVACRRLPWTTPEIHDFVVRSLSKASGTWVIGIVGAVAEFANRPGGQVNVSIDGPEIVAVTDGGRLRFLVEDDVRALTFDPPDTHASRQRIVLAVKRSRGRPPAANTLTDLGTDSGAIRPVDQDLRLYDLGLGRKEARFCVRCGPGAANTALSADVGTSFENALSRLGPTLLLESPVRVVESALGRIEVSSQIPPPGGKSPAGPHTHLLPDHIARGRTLPEGWDLPRAYLTGATFYPAA